MHAQKEVQTPPQKLELAEERRELAVFLRNQRADERNLLYQDSHVCRGIDGGPVCAGEGYNQIHGVDFRAELHRMLQSRQRVRLLDIGCGPGYFLKEMLEYAKSEGLADRLEVHGVTLTREFKVVDSATGDPAWYKPVLGKDVIHVGHAEDLRFPDGHFDMVVSTFGPYTYYGGVVGDIGRGKQLLDEAYRVTAKSGTMLIADNPPLPEKAQLRPLMEFAKDHPEAGCDMGITGDYLRIRIVKNGVQKP
jgi:SAM-dependent methyltransferase